MEFKKTNSKNNSLDCLIILFKNLKIYDDNSKLELEVLIENFSIEHFSIEHFSIENL